MSTSLAVAVDTSVAVPLLVRNHQAHRAVANWAQDKDLLLPAHAVSETYSVLTRLPGDLRLAPDAAAELIDQNFSQVLTQPARLTATIHRQLARAGIAGGAVYDALVALAAREHGILLATRDSRARTTYETLGVAVTLVPSNC